MPNQPENPYVPNLATIVDIREEVPGERSVKTFRVQFVDEQLRKSFVPRPGQCAMLSVLGKGESFLSLTVPPTAEGYIEFSVLRYATGRVTNALHNLEVGDTVGVRGPYGNGFPIDEWKSKDIIFIGGGIGQAPLRSVYSYMLHPDNRKTYGKLIIIYGARTSGDLVYQEEFEELDKRKDVEVHLSIDVEEPGWKRFVGFVPTNVLEVKPNPKNAVALTCGPPIMIRFVVQNLEQLGFKGDQIYTTLENRMKCGIGKCGRCNIGEIYVCKDGPVFTYEQIRGMFQEF
ncbi:MAG: FAD/NAD(P)-binding protein [Thermoplasmata archaeon]|nr:FAD/NAD(P)-binding protein [Thermoplasmata archaeon]